MNNLYLYGNRKIYFAKERRFTSYPEIVAWSKAHVDFQVVCHKTKNDITEKTLTRAVSLLAYRKTYGQV